MRTLPIIWHWLNGDLTFLTIQTKQALLLIPSCQRRSSHYLNCWSTTVEVSQQPLVGRASGRCGSPKSQWERDRQRGLFQVPWNWRPPSCCSELSCHFSTASRTAVPHQSCRSQRTGERHKRLCHLLPLVRSLRDWNVLLWGFSKGGGFFGVLFSKHFRELVAPDHIWQGHLEWSFAGRWRR